MRTEDAAQAQAILDEIAQFSVDDNGKEIQCPNCGAFKTELVTTVKDRVSFWSFLASVLLFGTLPLYVKYIYRCLECRFEFEIEEKN